MTSQPTYSFLDLENRLYGLLDQMRINELNRVEEAIKKNPEEEEEYHLHGLCAVLGYDETKHHSYFDTESGEKDILTNTDINLYSPEALETLQEAMEIDGAILIGADGKILHSGSYMQHDDSVYKRHPEANTTRLYLRDTFDGGTRHRAAIALSAQLPELLFYTLKSDHPQLRIFKEGSIYRSTVPNEVILPSYSV